MARKKKEKVEAEIIEIERIEKKEEKTNKIFNISEGFYYLLGIIFGIILIFATQEFLSTINYLFVVIFAVIAVIKIISFVMDKDYERKNYSDLVMAVMSTWIAMFIFKYGSFLFLELLPALVSLLLFVMAISSLTKYFSLKRKGNLVIGAASFLLGVLLIFLPGSIMDVFFKITGGYLLLVMILDLIDNKVNTYK